MSLFLVFIISIFFKYKKGMGRSTFFSSQLLVIQFIFFSLATHSHRHSTTKSAPPTQHIVSRTSTRQRTKNQKATRRERKKEKEKKTWIPPSTKPSPQW
jgi:hypothetical protein